MASDQRWKWAGIVSAVSIGGVMVTDIVSNVVGGYISDRIKATWEMPAQAPAAKEAAPPQQAEAMISSPPMAPSPQPQMTQPQVTMAAVTPRTPPARASEIAIAPEPQPLPDAEPEPEPEAVATPEPMPLPPEPQAMALSGTVEQVIDTGTLKIEGETIVLAGIKGLGSPYRDQLAKFIEEQGSQIRCTPSGDGHVCFVKNVDLALAALTNGAARLSAGATPQYQKAADEARRNRRGIFQ